MNRKTLTWILVILLLFGGGGLIANRWMSTQNKTSEKTIDESIPHDYYTCSMHPEVHQHAPGNCPICGMELIKVAAMADAHEARDGKNEAAVPGRGTITVSTEQQQLIGVKLAKVGMQSLHTSIRAYGRVAFDPELYQAQEEYISAFEIAKVNPVESSRRLLESAKTRLMLLGLSENQIAQLEKSGHPEPSLLMGAGEGGKVWIYANIYETEIPLVKKGAHVEVRVPSRPGHMFSGNIASIDPTLNPETRSARVRLEVSDPKQMLKPDTYVNAIIHSDLGMSLSIPASAILPNGDFDYVFVHKGNGIFEPRRVVIGQKADTIYPVLAGLKEGEEVVASGNFLIDSESQLRAGAGKAFYEGQEAVESKQHVH